MDGNFTTHAHLERDEPASSGNEDSANTKEHGDGAYAKSIDANIHPNCVQNLWSKFEKQNCEATLQVEVARDQRLTPKVLQMRTAHNSNVIQKQTTHSSVVAQMAKTTGTNTVQYKQFDKEQLMEANPFFQQVQRCFQWIEDKKASLETVEYIDDPAVIKQTLVQHQKKHDEIMNFKTEVEKCIAGRVSLRSLTFEEQKACTDLLSRVQETYPVLANTSLQQLKNLQSLQELVQSAIGELTWLEERTEETYKYNSKTSKPFEETYQNLMKALEGRLAQITCLQTKGDTMVKENHPASKIIQDYNVAIHCKYSWLQQLLNCLKVHIQHLLACKQFFDKGKICEEWMIQKTVTLKTWMMCQNHPVEELQMMQNEFQAMQMHLPELEKSIDSLHKRSCTVIPLEPQDQKVIQVQCLCDYKQHNMSFHKGELFTLTDSSQKTRWKVMISRGEFEIPRVCLQLLPPDVDALDFAGRLKEMLNQLKELTQNFVLSQIQFFKNLDVKQFQLLDLAEWNDLLRNLNDEAAKLLGFVESEKKLQVQKELEECKHKFSYFTRELQETEANKGNHHPVSAVKSMESIRSAPPLTKTSSSDEQGFAPETHLQSGQVFSCKCKEFKMRFEFETAEKCFKSNDFTIKEISPATMHYIAGTKDERDSLTEKLRNRHLSGIFDCGLLRIILQEEEDMAQMKKDPDDNSHLAEEVIVILKSHMQTEPVITEKILSQVGQGDVLKAQELEHLKCLRSSSVKIYIKESGKDIIIVGREVDKCIESICRALVIKKENEPDSRMVQRQTEDVVSSVLEAKRSSREYDTNGEVLNAESLEHTNKRGKELEKHGEASEHRLNIKLTVSATQMLEDSDYARALSKDISEVAVHYISNEVVFQGPPEAVMKAEYHLEQYLKSNGYWHEVDQTELDKEIRHMIAKRNISSQVLISYHLLSYVRKYLLENMKKNFDIDIQELDDLSGIKISGAEDVVQNAISEVQKQVQQMPIYIDSLEIPELTNTFARQVKQIVATVEEENKTVIDVIYLPGKGKVIKKVQLNEELDVYLVYGSTPGRKVDMPLIPVSHNWSPLCIAAIDLIKGDLQEKNAAAFQRYIDQKGHKPEDFTFIPYDEDNSQHIVYFVMPVSPSSWMEKFKQGLFAVFDYASHKNMASLSFPVEMHENLPVRQTFRILLETLNTFLADLTYRVSFRHIYMCSVEKCNQSALIQILDSVVPNDLDIDQNVEEEDSYHIVDNEDKQVKITIIVGSLLDQQVDVIVNSAGKELALEMGSLSKTVLNAAGMEIQDECRRNYPEGIQFGEVAVTSSGRLNFKKIFHGALCRVDIQKSSHLLVLRTLMKNCLKQAGVESCHSIAFPALGIGALNYPFETVAKEMFWAVTTYAKQYGVSDVKFVMPEDDMNVYTVFKHMGNTVNSILKDAQDYWPMYDISFEGCGVKVDITNPEKLSMCDVDVYLGKPKASVNAVKFPLFDGNLAKEATVTVNNDPKNWNERLYLCLDNLTTIKEVLYHALLYVKQMKLTSMCIYLASIKKESPSKSAIQEVTDLLAKHRLTLGELERVLIVVTDDMLQKLTPWFEENVKVSQSGRSYAGKLLNLLVHQVQVTWRKLQARRPEINRTHIRIIGPDYPVIKTSCETVEKKIKELIAMEETEKNKEKEGASYQTPEKVGSHGVHPTQTDSLEKDELDSKKNKEKEGASYQTSETVGSHGVHSTQTDSPENDDLDSKVYLNFKTEVAKKVLDLIRCTTGEKGISALVTELRKKAKVDASDGKIIICCDFQDASFVNTCVINCYREARKEVKPSQDPTKWHLIDGGNADTKELLQFAYSHKDWDKILTVEEGNLYLLGTLQLKEEVAAAVETVNHWCQEDLYLNSDEQQKAAEAVSVVKNEFTAVFIKQIGDRITIKGDNTDSFEKAKHRAKVTLGKIKITTRGRRRNLYTDGESFSSLLQDDRMEESPASLPSDLHASHQRAVTTSKTYYTREGITVKVYTGDIVRLPVDCIVNAANKNLSHGGGVALAIAKAAGREFDQESEEFVRRHGTIPVTQCCVTSAGRLPYKKVIHVVGPQWHDYRNDEKDRCAQDLKKTIVSCLVEANKWNMTSIAVTSISSGIFGVPKNMCAQMYVQGVIEFSRTYNLQSNSVKEIHFVDMLPEMCHLTQLAFDAEFNTRSNTEPVVKTIQRRQEISTVKTQNVSATVRPLSYAEATARDQGSKQKPYLIKPWDHTTILIYNHDITDVAVDAVVCPVFPNVEGGVVESLKRACGSEYADGDYKHVMGSIKKEGECCITKTPTSRPNLPFHHIIHIYLPHCIELEEYKHGKNLKRQIEISLKSIFNVAMTYGVASVALPILGIGDKTTPVKIICEYMIDGIATVCSDPHMVRVSQMTIHLVTNEASLAHQLKEIACRQFGQKFEVTGETLQNAGRHVILLDHARQNLQVTIPNDRALSVTYREPLKNNSHGSKGGYESQKDTCPICLDTPVDPKAFKECGHVLCRECMEFTVKNKPVCPVCGKIYGIITGNQPPGTMEVKITSSCLPGFKNCGTIDILYSFLNGTQTEGHPNPGKPYHGTSRRAYLPDNAEGQKVLGLLRKAFDRRLVFTIGRSVTTGAENTVTWNDIHHKTHIYGGPENYGFPDPDYLRRVQEELAAKGVTEDT